MASYNQKFNSDDSVIRHIIIGFLADLNAKLYFHRQLSNSERIVVDVPFYYSITGDDQFLRDNFLFSTASGPNCTPDKANADANYDVVPRGIVNISGITIDSAKLVNKRTMGNYNKMNPEGIIEAYVAEFDMIPITISFDIEILVSSTLDSFKITESIIKRMYKSNYFNVEVGHLEEGNYRIASYYALPEDYSQERPIGYTYEDKERYKITFPVEVNSFIPAFSWGNEQNFVNSGLNGDGTGDDDGTGNGTGNGDGQNLNGTGRGNFNNSRSTERFAGNRMFTIDTNVINQRTNEASNRIIDETDFDNR